ncbi:MAG: tyrosine-type recombinase/integrase [Pirellulales bacterium]
MSAVIGMKVEDYYQVGKRSWIRLIEKGGKHHEVPAHHTAEEYLDAYLEASGHGEIQDTPLFRSASGKTGNLTLSQLSRHDALRMVKRRALEAGVSSNICCHTFRATGITAYLENGGTRSECRPLQHMRALGRQSSMTGRPMQSHLMRSRESNLINCLQNQRIIDNAATLAS